MTSRTQKMVTSFLLILLAVLHPAAFRSEGIVERTSRSERRKDTERSGVDLSDERRPTVDGGWTEWSEWTVCGVTCDFGRRYRYRKCLDPPRQGGGRDCAGDESQHKVCDTGITCPVHGAWSEWSQWSCGGRTCGRGVDVRRRHCDQPPPSEGGSDCRGNGTETRPCLLEPCPLLFSSRETQDQISLELSRERLSLEVRKGDNLTLPCGSRLVDAVRRDHPRARVQWWKGGSPVDLSRGQTETNLLISSAEESDSGVYECMVREEEGSPARLVSFATLAVLGVTRLPREGEPFNITCDGGSLPGNELILTTRVTLNSEIVEGLEQEHNTGDRKTVFRLVRVGRNHTGYWKCELIDFDSGRVWVTRVIKLRVVSGGRVIGTVMVLIIVTTIIISACLMIVLCNEYLSRSRMKYAGNDGYYPVPFQEVALQSADSKTVPKGLLEAEGEYTLPGGGHSKIEDRKVGQWDQGTSSEDIIGHFRRKRSLFSRTRDKLSGKASSQEPPLYPNPESTLLY